MTLIPELCSTQNVDTQLETKIIEHEGMKKFVYLDSLGFSTIAIGRNIDPRSGKGLSTDECWYLMRNDLASARKQLEPFPWYQNQDTVRQGALVELVFNMGLGGFLKFVCMIKALGERAYVVAASELKQSAWATQVSPTRCADLINRIRFGQYL